MMKDAKSKVFVVMNQQTEWDFRASMYKHKGEFQEEEKIPKIYNYEKI